jgi:predicted HTH domain antitoxin
MNSSLQGYRKLGLNAIRESRFEISEVGLEVSVAIIQIATNVLGSDAEKN